MITGDGRQLGLIDPQTGQLLVMGQGRSKYTSDAMQEVAGLSGAVLPIEQWRGSTCNQSFCRVTIRQGERDWAILAARGRLC
jgi:competence protein ComEC